jgi:hypothetical protein
MEMDMQEPGEMCCCREEEHGPAQTEMRLQNKKRLPATVSRIILSNRGINYPS